MPTTPLPDTRPPQPPSLSASPVSALLQPPQRAQPPPDGPKFAVHQKVLAPQNRSETKYTGWVVSIIFGDNGAPPTYAIRFSKQAKDAFLLQETFAQAVIEAHPEPGLAPCIPVLVPCFY